jgi:hypothetical protein
MMRLKRRHSPFIIILLISLLTILATGCGKKDLPRLPHPPDPITVTDLNYTLEDNTLNLQWTVGADAVKLGSDLSGFKVFRSTQSVSEDACENCPIQFTEIGETLIRQKNAEQSEALKLNFSHSIETGYRYIYKVVPFTKNDDTGSDSNFVTFTY